jgi:hypothetical protein
METKNQKQTLTKRDVLQKKLDAVGWGLLFIWIGIALVAPVSWGTGLLGVGFITLGVQAARNYFGLKLEGFWIVAGLFFVLGGGWELFQIQLDLMPILCIVTGVALLGSGFVGKAKHQTGEQTHTL